MVCFFFFFFVVDQNSNFEWISSDPNCDRRSCQPTNCGKDFVAAALPGECCEKCVPLEYAASLGIQYPQAPVAPQPVYPYQQYNQAPQYQPQRVDVYIFGPDDGARVSTGQSIYFDCEVVSPYNQYAQPRWSRAGNQVSEDHYQRTNDLSEEIFFSHCRTKYKVPVYRAIGNSLD